MEAFDTNVIVRLCVRDDEEQSARAISAHWYRLEAYSRPFRCGSRSPSSHFHPLPIPERLAGLARREKQRCAIADRARALDRRAGAQNVDALMRQSSGTVQRLESLFVGARCACEIGIPAPPS